MKTAISIPDPVFRLAERVAKRRGISRSQLYTTALEKLLADEGREDVSRAYDAAFDDEPDAFAADAGAAALARVEWRTR